MAKKLRSEQIDLTNYYNKNESTPLIEGSNITITETEEGVVISSSGGGGGGSSDWEDIANKPATFAPSAHTHSATDIASGTLDIARIPTGDTASTVSLGNHTHTVANITGLESTLTGLENSVDNASNLIAGNNITLTPSGNDLTISASGGGGGGETYTDSTSIALVGNSIQRAALTGDVTSPLNSNVTTLSDTGVAPGTYNGAPTTVTAFTVDAKGRITAIVPTAVTITPAWGNVTGKPPTFAPSAHNHAAGEITSGTLDIGRIPTGITGSTVSLGNHSHDEIDNATDLTAIAGYNGTVKQYLTHNASGVLSWENA